MTYRDKHTKLSNICSIQTGFTARARLEPMEAGGVPAIQLRDLGESEAFEPVELPSYALAGNLERYWVGPGDILFRSRGEQNTAVTIVPDAKPAIAVLPLLVLRPKRELVDPHYLTWFINQPKAQQYFDSCARGTRLRMISRPCLENLEVVVPDLATQRLVTEIDRLARRECTLMTELTEKKKRFTSFVLLDRVQNAER